MERKPLALVFELSPNPERMGVAGSWTLSGLSAVEAFRERRKRQRPCIRKQPYRLCFGMQF
jgi:hypothetical protein